MASEFLEIFTSREDIIDQYQAPKDALDGAYIYLAWYGYGSYCGQSFVLFEKDGKLYEVNGSHCSCYGLEEQWKPEETSWEALKTRKFSSEFDGSNEAQERLNALVKNNLTVN